MSAYGQLAPLERGRLYSFSAWASSIVPSGAGMYTIWDNAGRLIYVGISGRGLIRTDVTAMQKRGERRGLVQRRSTHASADAIVTSLTYT